MYRDEESNLESRLQAIIREVQDFPTPGIPFKDITPLLAHPDLFKETIREMAAPFIGRGITKVVGLEARGFILGAPVALAIGAGFVPARKPGKLPYQTVSERYGKEYGKDMLELHVDGVLKGERVLIVDDVLATGGTARAAGYLVDVLGGYVVGFSFLMKLAALNGVDWLGGRQVYSILTY